MRSESSNILSVTIFVMSFLFLFGCSSGKDKNHYNAHQQQRVPYNPYYSSGYYNPYLNHGYYDNDHYYVYNQRYENYTHPEYFNEPRSHNKASLGMADVALITIMAMFLSVLFI